MPGFGLRSKWSIANSGMAPLRIIRRDVETIDMCAFQCKAPPQLRVKPAHLVEAIKPARHARLVGGDENVTAEVVQAADPVRSSGNEAQVLRLVRVALVYIDDAVAVEERGWATADKWQLSATLLQCFR